MSQLTIEQSCRGVSWVTPHLAEIKVSFLISQNRVESATTRYQLTEEIYASVMSKASMESAHYSQSVRCSNTLIWFNDEDSGKNLYTVTATDKCSRNHCAMLTISTRNDFCTYVNMVNRFVTCISSGRISAG